MTQSNHDPVLSGGGPTAAKMALLRRLAQADHGWAVVSTGRLDRSIQSTVVTAGLFDHPFADRPTVAYVARGGTVKLQNLRRLPRSTIVFRSGPEWITVEGRVTLIGPDDLGTGIDPAAIPQLLRKIYQAAGGTHDNWAEFDRVMAEERRTAVLIELDRVYSNPGL